MQKQYKEGGSLKCNKNQHKYNNKGTIAFDMYLSNYHINWFICNTHDSFAPKYIL